MRLSFSPFLLLVGCGVSAQNLVMNGDFEQYDTCPDFWNQLHHALGWSSAGLSPDYFNACDTTGYVDVPANVVGFQYAASGSGFAGGLTWCEFPQNRRELLRTELTSPFIPGLPVYLSMKVAAATDGFQEDMHWTVAGVGMRFSMAPMWYDQMSPLPDQAALSMAMTPTDTSIWYLVSGIYMPDSAYAHLAIGNFFSDGLVTPQVINPSGTHLCAYVYVDDICVSYNPDYCDMSSGIADFQSDQIPGLSITPNPAWENCSISWPNTVDPPTRLLIYDALGRRVHILEPLDISTVVVDLGSFSPGLYNLVLETPAGHRSAAFIVSATPKP